MNPFARDPRRSGRSTAPAAALLALLVSPPVLPGESPGIAAGTGEARMEECRDCEGSGKVPCETCAGKGEIRRPCPICKGSGKKRCPVCEDEKGGGRGRVECGLCRGQGVRAASGKACSRCQGSKTVMCLTCIGKGALSCKKQVVDRICPDCRFIGKVSCGTCDGSGEVDRAAARAAKPRSPTASSLEPGGQIEERYRSAARAHEAHFDIFSEDPTSRIGALRAEASRSARSLRGMSGAESEDALHELGRFISRADNFRRRFGELREEFLAGLRSKKKVDGLRESRAAALAEAAAPDARTEADRKWTNRIDIALKVLERETSELSAEEPRWLLKEVEDLEAVWKELKGKGEAVALAALRVKPARPRVPVPEPAPESESDLESVSDSDSDSDSGSDSGSATRAASRQPPADSTTASPAASRQPPAESAAAWVPVAWTAVGFLAATLVFRARARRAGRNEEGEDGPGSARRAFNASRRSSVS